MTLPDIIKGLSDTVIIIVLYKVQSLTLTINSNFNYFWYMIRINRTILTLLLHIHIQSQKNVKFTLSLEKTQNLYKIWAVFFVHLTSLEQWFKGISYKFLNLFESIKRDISWNRSPVLADKINLNLNLF